MSVFDYKSQPSVLAKEFRIASNRKKPHGGWNDNGGTISGLSPKSDERMKQLEPKRFTVYSRAKKGTT